MAGAEGIVVLGMGRSGTSAVTAMFLRAGFYAGETDELMPATDANPGGYWENANLWRLHEKILEQLRGSWFDPPPAEVQLAAARWAVPALSAEVDRILGQGGGAPIAIKDPRIGVMIPLWRPIIDERLHPVLVIRDPIEVASSLQRRDGTPPQLALAAWELHMTAVLDFLDGRVVTAAPYARLLADSELTSLVVEQAATHVSEDRAVHLRPKLAAAALERAYRHNDAAQAQHREHLTGSQLDLWRLLSSFPAGDQSFDVPAALRRPSAAARVGAACETERVRTATDLAAEHARANHLHSVAAAEQQHSGDLAASLAAERERASAAETAQLRAQAALRGIEGSASWRITRPLRIARREVIRRRSPARCEIHVAISPTPSFVTRVRYLATSVRRFGGALADSPVIVTVGDDHRVDLGREHPWSRRLGVEWRWVDEPRWQRHGIAATALQRFRYEFDAPAVLMLDADTLFVRPIDDALAATARHEAIRGLPAHVSPFLEEEEGQGLWQEIFCEAGLASPAMVCEHSGWQAMEFDPSRRRCPPYFNFGVLLASRRIIEMLGRSIFSDMEAVERVRRSFFQCQIALSLAILRSGAPWCQLPLRFNFPNDMRFLPRNQAELEDARIIHYLRDEQLNRADDFASLESVTSLLTRNHMHPVNARFCEALRHVHADVLSES